MFFLSCIIVKDLSSTQRGCQRHTHDVNRSQEVLNSLGIRKGRSGCRSRCTGRIATWKNSSKAWQQSISRAWMGRPADIQKQKRNKHISTDQLRKTTGFSNKLSSINPVIVNCGCCTSNRKPKLSCIPNGPPTMLTHITAFTAVTRFPNRFAVNAIEIWCGCTLFSTSMF